MTETEAMTIAEAAEKIREYLESKLTPDELKAFSFEKSPVLKGYMASLNGHEFCVSEINLKNILSSDEQIQSRAVALLRRLRNPKQFGWEEDKYSPQEVTIIVCGALRSVLHAFDQKLVSDIESKLLKEDSASILDMGRRHAILLKRFSKELEGVANG